MISFRTTGADRVMDGLSSMSRRAGTLGIASAPEVADALSAGYIHSLQAQGPGWPPLKPSTVRSRIADGYAPGPMLVRTHRLERSLRNLRFDAKWDEQTFSVPVPYAKYVLSDRRLKLDVVDRRAVTRALSRTLHNGYRGIT